MWVSTLFLWAIFVFSLYQKPIIPAIEWVKLNTPPTSTGEILSQKLKEKIALEKITPPVINTEKPKNKIEELRKKYALRGLITEANTYFFNDQFALALKKYSQIYEQVGDKSTAEKIGETYFKMQKFSLAYKYYTIVWDTASKEKAFLSLLYSSSIDSTWSVDPLIKELSKIGLSSEKTFFYKTSLTCVKDFHECKKTFTDYFADSKNTVTSNELQSVKKTFDNYDNFKLDDVLYKDALIIWTFYELWLYPVATKLWEDLLAQKPDYKPMLLIVAQSYYNLWNFENAKTYLSHYNELDPTDRNTTYLLWVIELKTHEYILSNIMLNKALTLWYEPRINVVRRLIFNYEILGQNDKLLDEFKNLIEGQNDFDVEDAYLAIYYHIINEKIPVALELVKFAQQKFPNDANLFGYLWWIYRDQKETEKADEVIQKGLTLSPNNALLNLNMGFLLLEKKDLVWAKNSFEKTLIYDKNGDFWKQAQEQLALLDKVK